MCIRFAFVVLTIAGFMLCQKWYLAEPMTKAETDYLKMVTNRQQKGSYWIGGSDLAIEGRWIWVHSNELINDTYTDWKPAEPNGLRFENCLLLYDHWNHQWNDASCRDTIHYVCEKKLLPENLGPVLPNFIG